MTIDELIEYLNKEIAQDFLQGDKVGLKQLQTTAGTLKAAAEAHEDKPLAHKFRIVAAQAANKLEELNEDH